MCFAVRGLERDLLPNFTKFLLQTLRTHKNLREGQRIVDPTARRS